MKYLYIAIAILFVSSSTLSAQAQPKNEASKEFRAVYKDLMKDLINASDLETRLADKTKTVKDKVLKDKMLACKASYDKTHTTINTWVEQVSDNDMSKFSEEEKASFFATQKTKMSEYKTMLAGFTKEAKMLISK